jgi:cation transport ATPase
MASVRAICFDKTGTLTTGEPTVAAFHVAEESAMTSALAVAYQLASSSTHSLSAAIKAYAQAAAADAPPLDAPRAVAGRGMQGLAPQLGATAYLGNAPYMVEAGLAMPATLAAHAAEATVAGLPLTFIGWQGQVRGMFVFREQLREQTAAVLATLADQSIAAAVLTGDHAAAALAPLQPDARSGAALKIVTRLLPEGKRDLLRQMREEHGPVAMVGDGINDAPALAAADVGIAMGCGADVSRESADVCLLGNDLAQIPWSLALARRTLTTIRQNLFWAYIYNIVGIGLALTGHLNPIWAAVAMIGSSLFVITNSLRLAGRADDLRSSLVELNPDGDLREPNAAAGTAAQSQ